MSKTIRLAVYFNSELRAVKELALPFVIGRSQDANLTIPHPMVSRRHCLLFEDKGSVRLQDLGSLNGTLIGEERIKDSPLNDHDEFCIGNIRFVFNPPPGLEANVLEPISESDLVDAEIILESSDDLPPPLPRQSPGKKNSVAGTSDAPPLTSLPQTPSSTQSSPTVPSFIKPLSLFPDVSPDGIRDANRNDDVIDLAEIADKEASTPPSSLREPK